MTLSTPRDTDALVTPDVHPPCDRRPIRRCRHVGLVVPILAGLAILSASTTVHAGAEVYTFTSVCTGAYRDDCVNGNPAIWTPPSGPLVSSSVSHAWSDPSSDGDSFSLSGAAQSSISGVDHWTSSVNAGGYIHSSYYVQDGISSTAGALIYDTFLIPSTSTWSGAGFLALTYHLNGDASVSYAYDGRSTNPANKAAAQIEFLCYSTAFGPCTQKGLTTYSVGTFGDNLTGVYDKDVTFFLPVFSDVGGAYQFKDYLSAGLGLVGDSDPSFITGGASADFTHTVRLVDADLLDSAMNPVDDWSITSGSGFDYAHIAAVTPPGTPATLPEPGAWWLLGLGGAGAGLMRRTGRRPSA